MKEKKLNPMISSVLGLAIGVSVLFSVAAYANQRTEEKVEKAWAHFRQGEYSQAESLAKELLHATKSGDQLETEYQAINLTLALRYTQNQYAHDLIGYEYRLEEIAQKLGDMKKLAAASNNLGYDLLTTGKAPIEEIIPKLEQANQIYAELEEHQGRWYTLMNLTWAYRKAGRLEDSKTAGQKAVARAVQIEDRHAIIETKLNLAETLLLMKQKERAHELVEQARAAAGNKEDRDRHVFEVYAAQHALDSGMGEPDIEQLRKAIEALASQEIFYEMLGRAVLAEVLAKAGEKDRARVQALRVIKAKNNFVPREALKRAEK